MSEIAQTHIPMRLLVGLGNPEPSQLEDRHNIGFMCLDAIASHHAEASSGAAVWREKFAALATDIRLGSAKITAIKPQTYMNASGRSVALACKFYKIPPQAVTVIHDDLDLAPGKIRIKQGGGHGGHNGLRDIDSHIGPNYRRLRIGIDHPGHKSRVNSWVLSPFLASDRDWVSALIETLAKGAEDLVTTPMPSRLMTQCSEAARPYIATKT